MSNVKLFSDHQEVAFEQVFIAEEVKGHYGASKSLSDDDRINYMIWLDANHDAMYAKHLPEVRVFRGNNPNIIFHGGCLGCLSQRSHGIDRCKGCMYFKFKSDKPNLRIQGEDATKMSGEDLVKFLKGE